MQGNALRTRLEQLKAQSLRLKHVVKSSNSLDEIALALSDGHKSFIGYESQQHLPAALKTNNPSAPIFDVSPLIGQIVLDTPAPLTSLSLKKTISVYRQSDNAGAKKIESSVQNQLIRLREENLNLEKSLKKFKSEAQITAKQIQRLNQANHQLSSRAQYARVYEPYLQFSQTVGTYYSKLPVLEDRLAELTFSNSRLDLTKGRIIWFPPGAQSAKQGREFYLVELTNVKYCIIGQNGEFECMMLTFTRTGSALKDYLFLRFDSEEQKKRWDVSIYINRSIELSLKKTTDQFAEEFAEQKKGHHFRESAIKEEDHQQQEEEAEAALANNQIDQILRTSEPGERKQTAEFASVIQKMNQQTQNKIRQLTLGKQVGVDCATQTQLEVVPKSQLLKSQLGQQMRKEAQIKQVDNAREALVRGFKLQKCGTWPANPKLKLVYLRKEDNSLAWEDVEGDPKKKKVGLIPVKQIYKAELGVLGQQHLKYDKTLSKDRCILLRCEERYLQLFADDPSVAKSFANNLQIVLRADRNNTTLA